MPKRNKDACPCCGATDGHAHDPDCALTAYLRASGFALAPVDSTHVTQGIDVAGERLSTTLPDHLEKRMDAPMLLDVAAGHMRDRAATYDQPGGERSMGRTVEAFNIITGRAGCDELVARALQKIRTHITHMQTNVFTPQSGAYTVEVLEAVHLWLDQSMSQGKARTITESEGWLLMQILKDVRDRQREAPHRDSLEDGIAYAALKAEARLAE